MTPAVTDYTLEVKYDGTEDQDDDFVLVEKVTDSLQGMIMNDAETVDTEKDKIASAQSSGGDGQSRYDYLPAIAAPHLLQTPSKIPPLYSFTRTTVHLLFSPEASQSTPTAVVLRGTSSQGPVELEIPVEVLLESGETIHQLAAKKVVGELEEGRGWISHATDEDGLLIKDRFREEFDQMAEREAVRLGVQYQVGGKWCSFVAVEGKTMTVHERPATGNEPPAESKVFWIPEKSFGREISHRIPDQSTT